MAAATWILAMLFATGGILAVAAGALDADWLMARFPRRYRTAARIVYILLGCCILVMTALIIKS